MGKKDFGEEYKSIHIGNTISVGKTYEKDNLRFHLPLGRFGDPQFFLRVNLQNSYSYVDLPLYDHARGIQENWRIYFYDLNGDKFNLDEQTPAKIVINNQVLRNELRETQNILQEIFAYMKVNSFEEYKKKFMIDNMEYQRKLTGGYGSYTPPTTPNTNK